MKQIYIKYRTKICFLLLYQRISMWYCRVQLIRVGSTAAMLMKTCICCDLSQAIITASAARACDGRKVSSRQLLTCQFTVQGEKFPSNETFCITINRRHFAIRHLVYSASLTCMQRITHMYAVHHTR